jgi:enterochelin esterase-like enzyme
LLAAGSVGLVGSGIVPGEGKLRRALGACDVAAPDPRHRPGPVVSGSFRSARRRTDVRYRIAYPPGYRTSDPLPVCLVLHGASYDERVVDGEFQLAGYLADAVGAGTPAFVLAAAYGGARWWHPRADGDDPLGMLADEFLPLLTRRGLGAGAGQRIGLLGYSMGGYGALLFAEMFPAKVSACAVGSPAIWRSYSAAAEGAFDSAADFSSHDVLTRASALTGVPVRVDVGRDDPFIGNVAALKAALPRDARVHTAPGCHDARFWRSVAPQALAFLGQTFATPAGAG